MFGRVHGVQDVAIRVHTLFGNMLEPKKLQSVRNLDLCMFGRVHDVQDVAIRVHTVFGNMLELPNPPRTIKGTLNALN